MTDTLVRLLTPRQLEAVLLHELAHIVFADCEQVVAMKTFCAMLSDGSLAGSLLASTKQKLKILETGFELTADRVMCHCMPEHWDEILSMFMMLAGGSVGEPLNAPAFLEQLKQADLQVENSIVIASVMKNPHPPIGFRIQQLQSFRQSRALVPHIL